MEIVNNKYLGEMNLPNITISDIKFINCKFDSFRREFLNCKFINCSFYELTYCTFTECKFIGCDIPIICGSEFYTCTIEHCSSNSIIKNKFINSRIDYCDFENAMSGDNKGIGSKTAVDAITGWAVDGGYIFLIQTLGKRNEFNPKKIKAGFSKIIGVFDPVNEEFVTHDFVGRDEHFNNVYLSLEDATQDMRIQEINYFKESLKFKFPSQPSDFPFDDRYLKFCIKNVWKK